LIICINVFSIYRLKIFSSSIDTVVVGESLGESLADIHEELVTLRESLRPAIRRRKGSDVTSGDYKDIFNFRRQVLNMAADISFLCWTPVEFQTFKLSAQPVLMQFVSRLIELSNSSKDKEVSAVEPVLRELFEKLMDIAFTSADLAKLNVRRWEYSRARLENTEYRGITDLSIVHTELNVSIGGLENKISSQALTKSDTGCEGELNLFGVKAVAQAGTQLLGSAVALQPLSVPKTVLSMIVTNGVQWIFTRRQLGDDGSFIYWHYLPISLANRVGKSFEAKDDNDDCYEQICHLFGLMFDNSLFLLRSINTFSLINAFPRMSTIDEGGYEDDDEFDYEDTHDLTPPAPPSAPRGPSIVKSVGSSSGKGGGGHNSGKKKTALGLRNPNIDCCSPMLTNNALRLHKIAYGQLDESDHKY
jgi:hypothetical protein